MNSKMGDYMKKGFVLIGLLLLGTGCNDNNSVKSEIKPYPHKKVATGTDNCYELWTGGWLKTEPQVTECETKLKNSKFKIGQPVIFSLYNCPAKISDLVFSANDRAVFYDVKIRCAGSSPMETIQVEENIIKKISS